jgi:hypothetical protein
MQIEVTLVGIGCSLMASRMFGQVASRQGLECLLRSLDSFLASLLDGVLPFGYDSPLGLRRFTSGG